ncbi:MAG: ribonuclease HI [Betaproteobacteria bacterium]|nr:ribonuclease HI [Betaproteobacteria bacterium]
MQHIEIYTDGACKGNPGPGGWGVLLRSGDQEKALYGGEADTTNNRMELTAAIEALKALRRPVIADIYTDSQYLIKGLEEWLPSWKARGWQTSDRKSVKNRDLWEQLDDLAAQHRLTWHWVKGHAGNPGNIRADALANQGVQQVLAAGGETATQR